MKKLFTKFIGIALILTAFFAGSISAQTVLVKFRVDMSEVAEISPLGVHIAGNFQGWDPGATEMTQPPFGKVYTYTQEFTPGTQLEYKYVNGNAWGMDESVPAGCAVGGNRYLTVPDQDITLDVVCFGSCTVCNPQEVDITFQVDMSNVTVSPNGVHVAGSFQGWNPASTEMLPVGEGVYAVTLTLGEGEYHEYKFVNGNAWGGDETVPPDCASGWNRYINVPGVSTTLDAVCFGSCSPCGGTPVDVEITFSVDMSQQEISPAGVHIAGGFQGWDPGATLMTDEGGGIYSYTGIFPSGTYQEYKFVNGITWDDAENLPPDCSNSNNRYFTVPDVNTVMDLVCFGLCGPCPVPQEVDITFRVDMSEQTVSGDGVYLSGSFNGFDPSQTPMSDQGEGIWTATVTLTEGDMHEYLFVNGLTEPETVPVECANANGYRELTVPGVATSLDLVCFGACGPCIPPPTVNVTFRVDMTNEEVSADGVHIAGSFQGWDPTATPMTDMGNGVYQVVLELVSGVHHNFKYINGNSFDFQESVPAACGEDDGFGGYNRFIDVPETDVELDLVCFGSCSGCVIPVDVDVTFQVDMSNETVSPDGVYIAGSFNGFSATDTPLTDQGNGVWGTTLTLTAGEHVTYKYLNGPSFDFVETVPAECGEDDGFGGYNRYLDVPETAYTIPLHCFSTCNECIPPAEVAVTFRVDMSEQTVAPEGVHVAGTFNNFSTSETPLIDMGDGIWAVELTLTEGDFIMYKFINGNTFQGFETVPPECSQEDGNRTLTVPGEATILDAVCFGSCEACVPPPTAEVTFQVDMSNETVSPEGVFIVGSFQGWSLASDEMTPTENNIYSFTTSLVVGEYIEFKYVNGITWNDAELIPGACASNDGNRYLTVPETATTLDLVCFASCEACIEPIPVDVTFQVDMSNEIVSAEGVYLAGSFNGFNPSATLMADQGNGIWATTVTLIAGDHVTYKYLNGPSFDFVELVPAECGEDDGFGGFNRYLDVPEDNYTIPLHCFSSCTVCEDLTHEIALFEGWNSLSSYIMPGETDIETLMSQIVDQLVIMQTMTEVYFPAGQLNTIGTWDSQSAYKIKVTEDVILNITGTPEQNKTLQLQAGWNLIPVISDVPVDVESLFAPVVDDVIVVKGIAEVGIYWPEYLINTLVNLTSGKAYFVKMNASGEITFP